MRLAQSLLGVLRVGREYDIEGSDRHNTLRSTLSEAAGQALCVWATVVQKRESNHSRAIAYHFDRTARRKAAVPIYAAAALMVGAGSPLGRPCQSC